MHILSTNFVFVLCTLPVNCVYMSLCVRLHVCLQVQNKTVHIEKLERDIMRVVGQRDDLIQEKR